VPAGKKEVFYLIMQEQNVVELPFSTFLQEKI
jgi:hypothetical protein